MILRASWVIPVSSPPIRGGAVRIDADRIVEVGPAAWMESGEGEEVVELGDAILTPGLVNPHAHLELTCYAGQLPPGPFWSWITRLVELRRRPESALVEEQCVAGAAWALLRGGVTCVGEISRRNISWRPLKAVPIRKVCFVELLSLADHPPRNSAELTEAVDSVEEDALLTVGVTPHAPYSVPGEHIAAALRLARKRGRPWTTHWAETREEVAFLAGNAAGMPPLLREVMGNAGVRSPGMEPMAYLQSCAEDGGPGSIAHANYVAPGEFDMLRRAGHVTIYCPRAHAFFGHERHPFEEMRAAGIRVAIGTDSAASNEGLSMLDEMRFVARARPHLPPGEILRMATLDAAAAIGLERAVGSIEPGKLADLAAWRVAGGSHDPAADLLSPATSVAAVWVAGEPVM